MNEFEELHKLARTSVSQLTCIYYELCECQPKALLTRVKFDIWAPEFLQDTPIEKWLVWVLTILNKAMWNLESDPAGGCWGVGGGGAYEMPYEQQQQQRTSKQETESKMSRVPSAL